MRGSRPGRYRATVTENRALSERYFLFVITRPGEMAEPGPGSFIHLTVPGEGRFYLRRPFSVLDCDEETISLIVVEKGAGTRSMRSLEAGAEVDLIGPLGSCFPPMPGKRILALAGGVGLAPLYYYWRRWSEGACDEFRLLYGARTKEDLFVDRFPWAPERVGFATDDGSYGFAGNVVEFAAREIQRSPVDAIFSCGPNPMLAAAADLASQTSRASQASRASRVSLPHYVSLENRMACALGACRSCVVLTRVGEEVRYRTVCKEGPVFDAGVLVWEELPEA